jgi:hypothetical protein
MFYGGVAMKSFWFVEALIIAIVLFVAGYATLPDAGLAATICQ